METLDPIGRMEAREKRELNELNMIEESLKGMILNDAQEWVAMEAWFEGDRRDGIQEVYYTCENPPSDIEDSIFDWIYDQSGYTRNDFRNPKGHLAKVIRYSDLVMEQAMPEQPGDKLRALQMICSAVSLSEPSFKSSAKYWSDFAAAAIDKKAKRARRIGNAKRVA